MLPLCPTAIAVWASMNVTPFRTVRAGTARVAHVTPPSVVRSDVPVPPTMTPVSESPNATPFNRSVLTFRGSQVVPPSVVRRIVPPTPTATPFLAFTKSTEISPSVVTASCRNQPAGGGCGPGGGAVAGSSSHAERPSADPSHNAATPRSDSPSRAPICDSPPRCPAMLHRHAELPQRVVQAGLQIRARLALADHQRARHAELAGGERLRPVAGDHHAVRRHETARLDRLLPGHVQDDRARGEHDARAQPPAGADAPAPAHDRAPA